MTTAAALVLITATTRRSAGPSGFRKGEQTTWWTRLRRPSNRPSDTSATYALCTSPPTTVIEAGGSWPSVPSAASRSSCIIRSNDRWKAGQCSRSSARRSFSPRRAASPPQAPAQRASLHASRWCTPGERNTGIELTITT